MHTQLAPRTCTHAAVLLLLHLSTRDWVSRIQPQQPRARTDHVQPRPLWLKKTPVTVQLATAPAVCGEAALTDTCEAAATSVQLQPGYIRAKG